MKLEDYKRQYGTVREPRPPAPLPATGGSLAGLASLLGGEAISRENGNCVVVPHSYPGDHLHGMHALGQLAKHPADWMSRISRAPDLAYLDLSNAVFLDTETTGLGMGAGTYVFLVGIGYLHEGRFQVKQFLLAGPEHERAFLSVLKEELERFSTLVTYNGKSFDWPLLENRFVLHRQARPFYDPLHLDLLHAARRLWKRRLSSCSLSAIESQILGVFRTEQDIPGYLIPEIYFQFVSSGKVDQLRRVFYHNLHDVLSLASLTVHMGHVMSDPWCGLVQNGTDFYSLGRVFERDIDKTRSYECYEEALRRGLTSEDRGRCLTALGALYKQERNWDRAVQTWVALLQEGGSHAISARIELAKYYEHVERDYMRAIDHVQHGLTTCDLTGTFGSQVLRQELEHRLSRLLNRAFRSRSWAASRL